MFTIGVFRPKYWAGFFLKDQMGNFHLRKNRDKDFVNMLSTLLSFIFAIVYLMLFPYTLSYFWITLIIHFFIQYLDPFSTVGSPRKDLKGLYCTCNPTTDFPYQRGFKLENF